MSPSKKQKCRIFLAKDLRQYRLEYRELMSHMTGSNWVLGNKTIDVENLTIKKFFKLFLTIFFILFIYYMFKW